VDEATLFPGGEPSPADEALTIGAVRDLLSTDFPSISISKIRYLEDQGLIAPKRTAGRYRLYSPLEVERLRTILRLQRDEFLPLRVIRQELESSTTGASASPTASSSSAPHLPSRRPAGVTAPMRSSR